MGTSDPPLVWSGATRCHGIYSAHTSGLAQHSGGRGNVTHAMQNATNEGPAERVYAPMPRGDTELDRLKPRVCCPDTQWDMTQGQRQIEQATPRARTFTTSMVQGMLSPQRTGPRNRRDPRIQVGSRGAPASSARTLFLWPERGARPEHHSELQIPAGRRAPSRSIYPHPEIVFFHSRFGPSTSHALLPLELTIGYSHAGHVKSST